MAIYLKLQERVIAQKGDYLFIDKNTVRVVRGDSLDILLGVGNDETMREIRAPSSVRRTWKTPKKEELQSRRSLVLEKLKTLNSASTGKLARELEEVIEGIDYSALRTHVGHDLRRLEEEDLVERVKVGGGPYRSRHVWVAK